MNNLQKDQEIQNPVDLNSDQQALDNAQIIIKQCNSNKKGKKIILFVLLPILILAILILILSTIFALMNIKKDTIINGVFIQGIDVSGLTIDQAKDKVNSSLNNELSKVITCKHNDYSGTILPSQFSVKFNIDEAVKSAYSLGRAGNIFENNYTILNTMSKNVNINPDISYDMDLINAIITEINKQLPDAVVQPSYCIDNKKLIISSGKDGVTVDSNAFAQTLISALKNIHDEAITIDIPVTDTKANAINLDSIYTAIHKDPTDAYYKTNPYVVYPSSTGLDFAISMDEAKNMLATPKDEYDIPLKTLYPKVTTSQIGSEAFPDLLSQFSTSFATSSSDRSTNISLATAKINGTVLMPGDTFSYNETVGKRTIEDGFKAAPAYSNGQVVQEVGGGICQVSSTLYNAILYANLDVTERHNHGFKPSYVKPGLDATVSWGGPDLKFKNNRNYPIKIVCDASGKTIHMSIYGLKTNNDYKVVLDAEYISTIQSGTVYQYTSSLPKGSKNVIESGGSNGCKTETYKSLYDASGNLVSKTCISKDTYNPHNTVIEVGN